MMVVIFKPRNFSINVTKYTVFGDRSFVYYIVSLIVKHVTNRIDLN